MIIYRILQVCYPQFNSIFFSNMKTFHNFCSYTCEKWKENLFFLCQSSSVVNQIAKLTSVPSSLRKLINWNLTSIWKEIGLPVLFSRAWDSRPSKQPLQQLHALVTSRLLSKPGLGSAFPHVTLPWRPCDVMRVCGLWKTDISLSSVKLHKLGPNIWPLQLSIASLVKGENSISSCDYCWD